MAFLQLEDLYGTTEVLVFPKVYERVSELLRTDSPVLLTGKLSVREEEAPKLLLDRVSRLGEEAPPPRERARSRSASQRGKLYLKLTAEKREAALEILKRTPGRIPVYLYMEDEKKTYMAPGEYWVDEGYDFFALADLLGEDNVVYK